MNNTITFLGKQVYLDENPRVGVCNRCGYVVGELHPVTGKVYKTTHMHHEAYDASNVLKHALELCPKCHNLAHWEGYTKKQKKQVPVKVAPEVLKELQQVGKRGETYSDILHRLIRYHKANS
jgi:hypothetical protein